MVSLEFPKIVPFIYFLITIQKFSIFPFLFCYFLFFAANSAITVVSDVRVMLHILEILEQSPAHFLNLLPDEFFACNFSLLFSGY